MKTKKSVWEHLSRIGESPVDVRDPYLDKLVKVFADQIVHNMPKDKTTATRFVEEKLREFLEEESGWTMSGKHK